MPVPAKAVIPKIEEASEYFSARIQSIILGRPLVVDLYLKTAAGIALFRKKNDILTQERSAELLKSGESVFHIPMEQREIYLQSLHNLIKEPDFSLELKIKFLKETAFLHVKDLFTKKDIGGVVAESGPLVENLISLISSDLNAVSSLLKLSIHDSYTYNHSVDVAIYSIVIAKRVYGDNRDMILKAGLGGLLHDIGKRRIDWRIINKQGPLAPREWEEIKKHPEYGLDVLQGVSVPGEVTSIVHEHHENFDGSGYPRGIAGDAIAQCARVVTIADVFDALTTNRSYHKAMGPNEALNLMFGMQPGKFDPAIFNNFNKNFAQKTRQVLKESFDPCSPQPLLSMLKPNPK